VVSSSAEVRSCCTFGGYFSKPLIASGDKVAFGAPRFVFSGVAVGVDDGEGVSVGDGVSLGSGVGEDFLFRFADGEALGDGELDFFFAEALGDGDADSFFVVDDFFFLCGVGVGVDKTFLILSPIVSSAACAGAIARKSKRRKIGIGKRNDPFITHTLAPSSSRAKSSVRLWPRDDERR
jgi:hypothetical protein